MSPERSPKFIRIQIVLTIKDDFRISLLIDYFKICLILEAKFTDDSLSHFLTI